LRPGSAAALNPIFEEDAISEDHDVPAAKVDGSNPYNEQQA
jgi:hypothetical protein